MEVQKPLPASRVSTVHTTRVLLDIEVGSDGSFDLPWEHTSSVRLVSASVMDAALTAGVPNVQYVGVNLGTLCSPAVVRGTKADCHFVIPLTGSTSVYTPGSPTTLKAGGYTTPGTITPKLFKPDGKPLTTADALRVFVTLEVDYVVK